MKKLFLAEVYLGALNVDVLNSTSTMVRTVNLGKKDLNKANTLNQ